LGVAVEEADESEHWSLVLIKCDIGSGLELPALYDEFRQLRAILKASHDTAPLNAARQKEVKSSNPNPQIIKFLLCRFAPAGACR
jgi:hypothetical protein